MIMRNATRALLAVTVAVAGLSACTGPKETDPSAATDQLEVMTWWTSASEAKAFKVFTDAYAGANAGVTLTNASVQGGAGSSARVALAKRLIAGDPPDVWQTFAGAATTAYEESAQIRDVSSVFGAGGLAAQVNPTILQSVTIDGKQYAVPTGAHRSNVLFFNKAVLDKAGVAAPAAGYTPAAFRADLEKVKASGVPALCLGAKDRFTTAELLDNILLARLGPDGWAKIQDDKLDWNGTEVKDALGELDDLLAYTSADADTQTWDQAIGQLVEGSCGFLTMNDSAFGELTARGGSDAVGEVVYPGTDGAFLAVTDVFVASRTAPNAKNALAFLSVLADPAANLEFSKLKGSVPVLKNVDATGLSPYQQEAAKALWAGPVLPSLSHGQAMNPGLTQGYFDAIAAYVRTRQPQSFAQAIAEAVAVYQPAGH